MKKGKGGMEWVSAYVYAGKLSELEDKFVCMLFQIGNDHG
jgi:hypothetical protein